MFSIERRPLAEGTFPARLDRLQAISELVAEAGRRMDLDERALYAIQTAVDEAATNIILHGYGREGEGPIHIACWQEGDDFVVEMRDYGRPFDPSSVPEPDLHAPLEKRREGGLGLFLMRRMMNQVEFARRGEENVLRMVRRRTPAVCLPPAVPTLSPQGRLDAAHAPQLEQMLREALEGKPPALIVDLAQVTYLSSSGLRALLVAAKQLHRSGGHLVLCCPRPAVARVLRLTGFMEILPVYPTREAALKAAEAPGDAGRPQ
ncbi:MAG: anti-sigma factor antagonist [Chloroflexia bacterium]